MSGLRTGITTGTTAAAAAKAAALTLTGIKYLQRVYIDLPNSQGRYVRIRTGDSAGSASAVKDSGDDPDVTNGIEIFATVAIACRGVGATCSSNSFDDVVIQGGEGIGVVTKAGLQTLVGSYAINPVPTGIIKKAVRDILPNGGIIVTLNIPEGRRVARKTYNERLGIIDGLSIIGTTGLVTPMSLDAVRATVRCEIDVAVEEMRAMGTDTLYLAPGKIGSGAMRLELGCPTVVQTSNYIGDALDYAVRKGVKNICLGGHPGKLAKIPMGYLDTHSSVSPHAAGYVAGLLGIRDRDFNTVEELITDDIADLSIVAREIAESIITRFDLRSVEIVLYNMKKERVGGYICTT